MDKAAPLQRFGVHVSTVGGIEHAFENGRRVGCDCIQIFVKNQRQWAARPLPAEQVSAFRAAAAETGIFPVFAHASYLLNLAAPEKDIRRKSIRALIDELQRCEALGIAGLVIHPGAHKGTGVEAGVRRIGASLGEVHNSTKGFACRILLESTAGQGSAIGHEIEHLGRILGGTPQSDRLGICLDSCHLFAAGYDLRKIEICEAMINDLAQHVGLNRIECMHTNDSKTNCGSRVDRHEHITKGKMGRQAFVNLLNDKRLAAVPRILETPKGKDGRGTDLDKVNLKRLRSLVAE